VFLYIKRIFLPNIHDVVCVFACHKFGHFPVSRFKGRTQLEQIWIVPCIYQFIVKWSNHGYLFPFSEFGYNLQIESIERTKNKVHVLHFRILQQQQGLVNALLCIIKTDIQFHSCLSHGIEGQQGSLEELQELD